MSGGHCPTSGVGVLVAAAAIALALVVTPLQDTTVAGEEIGVGAAAPTLSLSGPGEVDLFGQRLPTTLDFAGPVRPRLTLAHITLDRQLASMFNPAHGALPVRVAIGQALAAAWTRYFVWEACITGAAALLLTGALCGWARFPVRKTLVLLAVGLALAEVADLGGIMVTAYTAPARLAQVGSLTGLVGQAPLPTVAKLSGPEKDKVQAVVLGDSTAAALGNPLVAHASAADHACRRSSEAYAADLAAVNNWDVLNLACSGGTIGAGILGPQQAGGITVPAQLAAGPAGHQCDAGHREHRGQRRGLVRPGRAVRGREILRRQRVGRLLPAAPEHVRLAVLPAARTAGHAAVAPTGADQPVLQPVRHHPRAA